MYYEFSKFEFQNAFVILETRGIRFRTSRPLKILNIDFDTEMFPAIETENGCFFLRSDDVTSLNFSVTEDEINFLVPDSNIETYLTIRLSNESDLVPETGVDHR